MLHRIFIISADAKTDMPGESRQGNIYFQQLLHPGQTGKLQEAYAYFSGNRWRPFSVCVMATGSLDSRLLQSIAAFTFIPGYCSINNNIVVNILATDGTVFETCRQQLTTALEAQGIRRLLVNHVSTAAHQGTGHGAYPLFDNIDALLQEYEKSLHTDPLPGRLFFFRAAENNTSRLLSGLCTLEEEFRASHPMAYAAAVQLQVRETEIADLEKKNEQLMLELNNYRLHLETIRSGHEAKLLQAYYDKEYEILPLWFKRAGHIVKVLTGKRRLLSLFNNQTKKYKD